MANVHGKKTSSLCGILAVLFGAAAAATAGAPDPAARPVREVFVPYADLEPLLRKEPRRMMLSRQEYDDLLAKARQSPAEGPAARVVLSSADYSGTVEAGEARFVATLTVNVLDDDLLAVPLPFAGVGILKADLDGSAAPLGEGPDGKLRLFVHGRGIRRLTAELMVPLSTTAARQSLSFQLPVPPGTRLRLSVPGDVEMKSGAAVAARSFDEKAGVTRFELLPQSGRVELRMSLNSRMLKRDRVVAAHGVVFDEVTGAYERLHARFSFDVLHGSAAGYRFQLPDGFDVTTVLGRDMASWRVVHEAGKAILEVQLRDATTETVALNIGAERTSKAPEQWTMPRIEPLDVIRRDLVAGVLLEDRFEVERMESQGLIALDTQNLSGGLAASMLKAVPGAPQVRAVAAWYAPLADYRLTARFRRPESQVSVVTSLLLSFSDQGEDLRGEFALQPAVEKLFAFDFKAPTGWTVDTVTAGSGGRLKFDVLAGANAAQRIHVKLPRGVAAGEVFKVQFHAAAVPAGWLDPWQKRPVACPVFAVEGAKNDQGILAVKADDDIIVDPGKTLGLSPLYGDDKARFGLEKLDAQVALAYRQQPYSAAVSLRRPKSWVSARTFQFFKVQTEAVHAHYELQYFIAEARTSVLAFTLPESTPLAVSIEGLDGVKYKEYRSETTNGLRRWTVELAERRLGRVRLKVTLTQKLDDKKSIALKLPLAEAQVGTYQSGIVAVEGSPELDVRVAAGHPREVDVGELAAADYVPGKQLLGAYAFVGNPPAMALDITRSQDYGIPTSLVQKASLVTAISAGGVSQTSADFELKTKDNYLHIVLPDGSTLWSVMIDALPGRPQRDADGVLVVLPPVASAPGQGDEIRHLRIAYQTPVDPLALSGRVRLKAPRLRVRRSEDGAGLDVPVADVQWQLQLPDGYVLVDSDGTVQTSQLSQDEPLKVLGAALYVAGGGMFEYGLLPAGNAVRKMARARHSEGGYSSAAGPTALPGMGPPAAELDKSESMQTHDHAVNSRIPFVVPAPKSAPAPGDIYNRAPAKTESPPSPPGPPMPSPPASTTSQTGGETSTFSTASGGQSTSGGYVPEPTGDNTYSAKGSYGKRSKFDWFEKSSSLDISLNVGRGEAGVGGAELATFHSLGEGVPSLDIRVVESRRIGFGAWGVGLLVALVGMLLTRRPARTKFFYVSSVILLSIVVPLVVPPTLVLARAFDAAFVAAGLLVFYYLAAGFLRWLLRLAAPARPTARPVAAVAVFLALSFSSFGGVLAARAAEPYSPHGDDGAPAADRAPLHLPENAILIPYDPNQAGGIEAATRRADHLLVPLERYIQLWNQVHPNKKLHQNHPPAEFALAGGEFAATLSDADTLNISGHIDIDLFVDRPVEIPLNLSGVVLSRAEVEGKPARLRLAPPVALRANAPYQRGVSAEGRAVLQLEGQGRKRLVLELQLPISKSGGWRSVRGRVPAAPATLLRLEVPNRGTEVCTSCGPIVEQRETSRNNEQRDVPLAADGTVDLRWRGHVDDASADPTLTVESDVLADVREDAWRVAWHASLRFARQQREAFELSVPGDYLVERVLGSNVRGWEVTKAGDRQRIDVGLLAPATGQENFTILLSRTPAADQPGGARFEVPKVEISGANLHRGTLTIRRSVRLDVQVATLAKLQQVGLPANVGQLAANMTEGTLDVKALAAYRFVDTSFSAALAVRPLPDDLSCELQTLVRLESPDVELASHLVFHSSERPVYQVRLALPKGLAAERVTSESDMLYSVSAVAGRDVLSVNFSSGQVGTFSVDLAGRMKDVVADGRAPLPQLQLLDVRRQQGEIVVQAPRGFEVRAQELSGCSPLLLSEVNSWLDPAHQALAGLAVRYLKGEYGGQLALSARSPHIQVVTVTNVRYTPSAIEQTVHLQFDIKDAGIRQLAFLLPEALRESRIAANRSIRQKSIDAAADRPGWVRVRLEFQELQMGVVNVEATHDQLLDQKPLPAPIPVVETGKTNYRYVALENSSRDEVEVARQQSVEPLSRRQSAQQTLDGILGERSGEAFVVQEGAADEPLLELKTTPRKAETTAGARIRLAETVMIVDGNGAYRAGQVFYVDNRTRPVLTLELPAGARLWTVRVAGELVKPVRDAAPGSTRVLVPLVRTLEGDRDYQVEIKYGGQLPSFGLGRSVSFPTAKAVDIHVEQTHVQLRLPETQDWFDFGGTATKVEDAAALEAGRQEYRKDETRRIIAAIQQHESLFAQTRGRAASESLKGEIQRQIQSTTTGGNTTAGGNEAKALGELQQQAVEINKELQKLDARQKSPIDDTGKQDNREILTGSLNQATDNPAVADLPPLAGNWKSPSPAEPQPAQAHSHGFNKSWYEGNGLTPDRAKLLPQYGDGEKDEAAQKALLSRRDDDGGDRISLQTSGGKNRYSGRPQSPGGRESGIGGGRSGQAQRAAEQPSPDATANGFFQGQQSKEKPADQGGRGPETLNPASPADSKQIASKYQQRLEERNKEQEERIADLEPERRGEELRDALKSNDPSSRRNPDEPAVLRPGQVLSKQTEGEKGRYSLDVTLPERGRVYYFTAVRGAPEITARAVPDWLVQRLQALAWIAAALVIGLLVYWGFQRAARSGASTGTLATLLIVGGILSICTGVLPVYGLLALVAGIIAALRGRFRRATASA